MIKLNILTEWDLQSIFSNIKIIVEHHEQKLLPELEKIISNWKDQDKVGQIFSQRFTFMDLYATYINDYNSSFAALHYYSSKYPSFAEQLKVFILRYLQI